MSVMRHISGIEKHSLQGSPQDRKNDKCSEPIFAMPAAIAKTRSGMNCLVACHEKFPARSQRCIRIAAAASHDASVFAIRARPRSEAGGPGHNGTISVRRVRNSGKKP